MVKINYDKEKERIFALSYVLNEYIPDSILKEHSEYPELQFIQKLFSDDSNVQFIGESPMIWSVHYIYKYKNKSFTLVLDEDYDLITYSVENSNDRIEIAEYICKLIEKQKMNK
jgi:hypothetical protein